MALVIAVEAALVVTVVMAVAVYILVVVAIVVLAIFHDRSIPREGKPNIANKLEI